VKAPQLIETARLMLTEPQMSDAAAIFERYAGDPDVTRYVGWPRHRSVADTEGFLAFSASEWARWSAGPYLIRSREDQRLLGSTGLSFETGARAMTGYVLAKDSWGQGYATEALRAMVDVARALGVSSLFALCHPDHRASWHVLEKCGFTRDAAWTETAVFPNLAAGVQQAVFCYTLTWPIADSQ
jgi:RimJ/RimL family protein N-acetyltransferase